MKGGKKARRVGEPIGLINHESSGPPRRLIRSTTPYYTNEACREDQGLRAPMEEPRPIAILQLLLDREDMKLMELIVRVVNGRVV